MDPISLSELKQNRREHILSVFRVFIIASLSGFLVFVLIIGRFVVAVILTTMIAISGVNYFVLRRHGTLELAGTLIMIPYMMFAVTMFIEGGTGGTGHIWSFVAERVHDGS